MNRLHLKLFFLAFTLLSIAATSQAHAKENYDENALRLEKLLNEHLTGSQKSFESTNQDFITNGEIQIEKAADYYAATLPSLKLELDHNE